MKLKKGMKVEVFSTRDVPSGSWWTAEIISNNGRSYFVRYDHCRLDQSMVESVPRKLIRPCPPEVFVSEKILAAGNIVEVFHNGSWKLAQVSGISDGDDYFVRLLGLSGSFRVHSSCLRVRQIWQDNKWIMKESRHRIVRSTSRMPARGKSPNHLPRSCVEVNNSEKGQFHVESRHEFLMEPARMISNNLKKRPLISDECSGTGRKIRIHDDGKRRRVAAGCSVELQQKGQIQRL